jgi:4-nitrophenyl phosphatase
VLLTADSALPATGATVAALRACTDAEPVCVGKPSARFFEAAIARLGVPAGRVLTVGDSLTADIAGGQAAGTRTALMLSGVTPVARLPECNGPRPDYVFSSLAELTGFLRRNVA